MKDFREAYKEAVDGIQVPVITVEQIADEGRRKKIIQYRRYRKFMAVATAACVFLVCTAGVAAAAGYAKSVIKADEFGFKTADTETARLNNWAEDEKGLQEASLESAMVTEEAYDFQEDGDAGIEAASVMEMEEVEQREYGSYAEFREGSQIPLALPDTALLGQPILSELYLVCGEDFLFARIDAEDRYFMINQSYYGETQGHASSIVYPDGVCNERSYTTVQGFTYTVIDSVNTGDEPPCIHAAISIGDYELIVDFDGYSEEEAFKILDAMDLTIYL
ncbi:MAG: hypothetical protein ACI4TB_01775 [Lachnospiraceae bacterium]